MFRKEQESTKISGKTLVSGNRTYNVVLKATEQLKSYHSSSNIALTWYFLQTTWFTTISLKCHPAVTCPQFNLLISSSSIRVLHWIQLEENAAPSSCPESQIRWKRGRLKRLSKDWELTVGQQMASTWCQFPRVASLLTARPLMVIPIVLAK